MARRRRIKFDKIELFAVRALIAALGGLVITIDGLVRLVRFVWHDLRIH